MSTDAPEDSPQAPPPSRTNIQGDAHGPVLSGTFTGNVYLNAPADRAPGAPQPTAEEVEGLRERLGLVRETLRHLLKQLAIMGSAYAPPHLMHGIREARSEIAHLKKSLRDWGVAVADHPDDER
jgi:hypothetical protein